MKNIKIINYLLLTFLLLFSCDTTPEDNKKQKIRGSIDSITIDFVKQRRNWCRTSHFIYTASLTNNTFDTVRLIKQKGIEFCNLENRPSQHYLILPRSFYNSNFWEEYHSSQETKLMVLNLGSDISIPPKESYKIEFLLQLYIYGFSLSETERLYEDLIKSDFSIQSSHLIKGYDTINFQKSNDFEIIKEIDDEVVFSIKQKTMETLFMKKTYLDEQTEHLTKMIRIADDIGVKEKMIKSEEFEYYYNKYNQSISFFEKKYGVKYTSEKRKLLEGKFSN